MKEIRRLPLIKELRCVRHVAGKERRKPLPAEGKKSLASAETKKKQKQRKEAGQKKEERCLALSK